MPYIALIRNLGKMGSIGLIDTNLSPNTKYIADKIIDHMAIAKSMVHPMQILLAASTYASGHGVRGSLRWPVARIIVEALDQAFYMSFKNVEPTGKNFLLALDVSGSMTAKIANTHLSAREASAAMALVTARTEPMHEMIGFTSGGWSSSGHKTRFSYFGGSDGVSQLNFSPMTRLPELISGISRLQFGGTDCALPMLWATERRINVDCFVVYTDSETWAGSIHPKQALDQYRQRMGRDAKCIVVGMTSTGFSIADPKDPGMLDVVGFDASVPGLISNFVQS